MFESVKRLAGRVLAGCILSLGFAVLPAFAADPLPSWNDGESKSAIVDFVTAVSTEGGPDFIAPADRIATFDNDGTLWAEQPMYVQLAFVLDRIKALAPEHPDWQGTEPFKSALAGDMAGVAASGEAGLLQLLAATHSGMTSVEFTQIVSDWVAKAKHPETGKLYTAMIYQPMLELIRYLKANDFDVFIVSGGGIEFMRPWTEQVYGIPPQNVVGSTIETTFEMRDGGPVLLRGEHVSFIDDGPGKPVGIQTHIGKHPIAAFGNSDGDLQMLQWVTSGLGKRFGGIVHHDDEKREYAYDRKSHFGKLDKALDLAPSQGWQVFSIKQDWKSVHPQ